MTMLGNGYIGIGLVAPQSFLHVANGVSGVAYTQPAVAHFESSGNAFVNIKPHRANVAGIRIGSASDPADYLCLGKFT
ncbi:hypothetical protein MASR2M39_30200 [Ignavibacteriales bacterium]